MGTLTLIAVFVMGFVMYRMAVFAKAEMRKRESEMVEITVTPATTPQAALTHIRLWTMAAAARLHVARAHPFAEGTSRRLAELFDEVEEGLRAKDRE